VFTDNILMYSKLQRSISNI